MRDGPGVGGGGLQQAREALDADHSINVRGEQRAIASKGNLAKHLVSIDHNVPLMKRTLPGSRGATMRLRYRVETLKPNHFSEMRLIVPLSFVAAVATSKAFSSASFFLIPTDTMAENTPLKIGAGQHHFPVYRSRNCRSQIF